MARLMHLEKIERPEQKEEAMRRSLTGLLAVCVLIVFSSDVEANGWRSSYYYQTPYYGGSYYMPYTGSYYYAPGMYYPSTSYYSPSYSTPYYTPYYTGYPSGYYYRPGRVYWRGGW
jgi:hypothetical protein